MNETKIDMETKADVEKDAHAKMIGFLYIALTILFTVYGQMIIKWQVSNAGDFPPDFGEKIMLLFDCCSLPGLFPVLRLLS
jgi:hypothetical protein